MTRPILKNKINEVVFVCVKFIYFIRLFTHIQSTTCCCMINVVLSKATANSGGIFCLKKNTHLSAQANSYVNTKIIHGEGYNSNYSVHKYLISSFKLLSCFLCIEYPMRSLIRPPVIQICSSVLGFF